MKIQAAYRTLRDTHPALTKPGLKAIQQDIAARNVQTRQADEWHPPGRSFDVSRSMPVIPFVQSTGPTRGRKRTLEIHSFIGLQVMSPPLSLQATKVDHATPYKEVAD